MKKSMWMAVMTAIISTITFFQITDRQVLAEDGAMANTSANVQDFNAPKTTANVLALAEEYDPDGYYLMNYAENKNNSDFITKFCSSNYSNAQNMDTAVHESVHSFSVREGQASSTATYIGDRKFIKVRYTPVFRTSEWTDSIPETLRTFRYSTYVEKGSSQDANTEGVYGLLDELNAYNWGLNSQIKLFDYYNKIDSQKGWDAFCADCENDCDAFCEFRWWILGYLNYAQKNYNSVWNQIMSNQNFIDAYCITEQHFENLTNKYLQWSENNRKKSYVFTGTDRDLLLEQIKKPELQAQEQYLFSHKNDIAFSAVQSLEENAKTKQAEKVFMYRLYNPSSGEHFYTASNSERESLVKAGWKYEGIGWNAPKTSKTPVYRLYNPNAGEHHYTTKKSERDSLIRAGWKYENIGWYSDDKQGKPLYRQYNPNAKTGTHNYTTSQAENDQLVKLGWRAEGIGWYGVA